MKEENAVKEPEPEELEMMERGVTLKSRKGDVSRRRNCSTVPNGSRRVGSIKVTGFDDFKAILQEWQKPEAAG